jgi:hypothetical protein
VLTTRKPSREREVVCVLCDTPFLTRHSQGKYCSPECRRNGERSSWNKYGNKNKKQRSEYHRKLYERNKEKVLKRTSEYSKTERGKEAIRISGINQREKHPEKYRARMEVLKAKRKGTLIKQPCEICGDNKVEAHHEDYSKPLEIKWLCTKHHKQRHKELREMGVSL